MAETGVYSDESTTDGVWGDGAVWTIGQTGIWIGMPNLFIGIGTSFADATYSDETVKTGVWGD